MNKCGNCAHKFYTINDGGELICKCTESHIVREDGSKLYTFERVRWNDKACDMFKREEEHDD